VIRADRSSSVALSLDKATNPTCSRERKVNVRPGHRDPAAAPLGKGMCTMAPHGLVAALAGLAFNPEETPIEGKCSRRKFSEEESGITLCWPADTGCFCDPNHAGLTPYCCGNVFSIMGHLPCSRFARQSYHARPFVGVFHSSILERFVNLWHLFPTKWLHIRPQIPKAWMLLRP
jgi:hypothetical protein